MAKSLTYRLRQYAEQYETPPTGREVDGTVELLREAADRIERYQSKHYNSLEDCAHKVYAFAENVHGFTKTDSKCPNCGNKLRAYYYEARLYGVRCDYCQMVTLVEARNPHSAAEIVGGAKEDRT